MLCLREGVSDAEVAPLAGGSWGHRRTPCFLCLPQPTATQRPVLGWALSRISSSPRRLEPSSCGSSSQKGSTWDSGGGQPPPRMPLWTRVQSWCPLLGLGLWTGLPRLSLSQDGPPPSVLVGSKDPGDPVGKGGGSGGAGRHSSSLTPTDGVWSFLPLGLTGACQLGPASCRWILRDTETTKEDGNWGHLIFFLP